MAEAFALRLPLVRRFKRPPARLVYAAMVLLLDLLWVAACVMWLSLVAVDVLTPVLFVGWSWFAVRDHRKLRRLLADYAAGRKLAPVSRPEWRFCVVGYTLWLMAAPPAAFLLT